MLSKEGNHPKKARIYALAIPKTLEGVYRKKIKQFPYGWSLLKLEVFLVGKNKVEVKNYKHFLK